MIIRIKFLRGDAEKYIGHLDLMRFFHRALKRAGLPIAYSKGFNPHPHMVFGLPLGVGITSQAEYADFELDKDLNLKYFIDALNNELTPGFRILDAKAKLSLKNIMASVNLASYDVLVAIKEDLEIDKTFEWVNIFLSQESIIIEKESAKNKKTKKIDIREKIYKLEPWLLEDIDENKFRNISDCDDEIDIDKHEIRYKNIFQDTWAKEKCDYYSEYNAKSIICFSMLLDAGGVSNLKPQIVIMSFFRRADLDFEILKIHRTGLFIKKDNKLFLPIHGAVLLD